jgi:lysozyme
MNIPKQAIELIKKWEGFRANTYKCSAGVLTIGYGTTAAAGVGVAPKIGDTITEPEAEELLILTVKKMAGDVLPAIKKPLTDNQLSAVLSLVYNIGARAFLSSTLLKKINDGDFIGAGAEFRRWNKGGGQILRGLVLRRAEEATLFLLADEKKKIISLAIGAAIVLYLMRRRRSSNS